MAILFSGWRGQGGSYRVCQKLPGFRRNIARNCARLGLCFGLDTRFSHIFRAISRSAGGLKTAPGEQVGEAEMPGPARHLQ